MIDFIIHLDKYLNIIIQNFGIWAYLVLFLIVFAETGFVVTPFLPGDSLLFATGAFCAIGSLNVWWVFFILLSAAIAGDSINYSIGKMFGDKVFEKGNKKIFKKEYLDRTHNFYEKYGGKTIVIARFVPIIRTFAPFVAGVCRMNYRYFFIYNVTGGILWVSLFVFSGFFFGNLPFIKKNFTIAIFVIIALSILPAVLEICRHKKKKT